MNNIHLDSTEQRSLWGYMSYSTIYFFYFGASAVFSSMLSVYLAGNDKSAAEIAFIVSGASIFTMILQPVIGTLYDRIGKDWQVSVLLLILSGVLGFQFVWLRNTVLLFLFNGFTMAFLNSISPVCERLATQSPFRYGVIRVWGAVGYAAGSQVSGIIFEHSSPFFNFSLFVVAVILTGVGFWNTRTREHRPAASGKSPEGSAAGWRELWSDPTFLLFALFCFLFSGSTSANNTYLPILLQELLGSSTRVGTVLSAATMLEIPVILLSHKFMDRFSGKALLAINTVFLLVQYACYAFCSAPALTLICIIIVLCKSVATMLFIMVSLRVVLDLTGGRNSTMALSAAASIKSFGGVAMTYLAGYLMDSFGIRMVFMAMSAAALFLLLLISLMKFPEKKRNYFNQK